MSNAIRRMRPHGWHPAQSTQEWTMKHTIISYVTLNEDMIYIDISWCMKYIMKDIRIYLCNYIACIIKVKITVNYRINKAFRTLRLSTLGSPRSVIHALHSTLCTPRSYGRIWQLAVIFIVLIIVSTSSEHNITHRVATTQHRHCGHCHRQPDDSSKNPPQHAQTGLQQVHKVSFKRKTMIFRLSGRCVDSVAANRN